MTHLAQGPLRPRAPRVIPPQGAFASIQLENGRHFTARLQRISVTGGLLDLAAYIEERVPVTLTLAIGTGMVHARAEMLFPMRSVTGYLQPFRFSSLRAEQLHILEREISQLLQRPQTSAAAPRVELGVHLPNYLLELL